MTGINKQEEAFSNTDLSCFQLEESLNMIPDAEIPSTSKAVNNKGAGQRGSSYWGPMRPNLKNIRHRQITINKRNVG